MKNLALLLCMVITLQATAQKPETDSKAPIPKYEVSLLAGRVLGITDNLSNPLGSITLYKNFSTWQPGIGVELQLAKGPNATNTFNYVTPYVAFNKMKNGENLNYYVGGMIGYTFLKYQDEVYRANFNKIIKNSTTGEGIVGGLQGGIILKIYKFISFNTEFAVRVRRIKKIQESGTYIGSPSSFQSLINKKSTSSSSTDVYLPLSIGLRLRF